MALTFLIPLVCSQNPKHRHKITHLSPSNENQNHYHPHYPPLKKPSKKCNKSPPLYNPNAKDNP